MNIITVTDFKDERTTIVYLLDRVDTYRKTQRGAFKPALTEIHAGITFPCGDAYIAWLPIFTDWF